MNIDWSKAPEGATHWVGGIGPWHKHIDNVSWYWHEPGNRWLRIGVPAEQVEVEYIDTIVKRPDEPWTGAGLPPVGTVCEVQASHIQDGYWTEIEILAHAKHDEDDALLVCQLEDGCRTDMDGVIYAPERFRQIRTQEQIEAEERDKALSHFAYILYRDVGMDRRDAELLWNKGYRKQPKEDA